MARAAVDCFSYLKGFGLSVTIDKVIPPNGIEHDVLVERPDLVKFVTAFNLNPEDKANNFDAMFRVVITDPSAVFLALTDLIASISGSHYAHINCARAIETIREAMTPQGKNRKSGWEAMRRCLNVDEKYLKFITDVSTAGRHGTRIGAVSQQEYDETIKRSWIVMNRFLEFKKRGAKQLPINDFPLLS